MVIIDTENVCFRGRLAFNDVLAGMSILFQIYGIRKVYNEQHGEKTDVILIGAGVMSATLGALLKELVPEWEIKVFEKLASAGKKAPMSGIMRGPAIPHCVSLTIRPKTRRIYRHQQSDQY